MSIYKEGQGGGAAAALNLDPSTLKEIETKKQKLVEFGASATPTGKAEWSVKIKKFNSKHHEAVACYHRDGIRTCRKTKNTRATSTDELADRSLVVSLQRTRKSIRERSVMMQADRLLTCTTRQAVMDREEFGAIASRFFKFIRAELPKFKYIAVFEKHDSVKTSEAKRGSYHLHIASQGFANYDVLRRLWRKAVRLELGESDEVQGSVNGSKTMTAKKPRLIAWYLAKYMAKDVDNDTINKKRYWSSRNIEKPESFVFYVGVAMHPIYIIQTIIEELFGVHLAKTFCPDADGPAPPVIWLSDS